jgi:ATP-dependent Lon protease
MAVYPLFPLPVVLFPGTLMPLHIFEPRYRTLLADAAQGDHRFVILPPGPAGEPPTAGTIGTVARIRGIQPLPDGRSNIVISGDRRITLAALVPSPKPYLLGSVADLDDTPDSEVPSDADIDRLRAGGDRYAQALAAIADLEREADLSGAADLLSFQVAALMEWDFDAKQRFLAIRSPRERVVRLLQALPALIADAEGRATVHRRAKSNGTGHH